MRHCLIVAALAAGVAACAKSAADIAPAYVSPILYENYNCRQLGEEAQRVSARAAQVSGVQDQKATGDAVATTVGLIIFWPTLLLIKGNDQQTAELANLKGQMDAIEQVSIRKQCGIVFNRPAPPPPVPPRT